MGSDGSAACGGRSDLSEWQRSTRDEGVRAKDIRRAPQQDIGRREAHSVQVSKEQKIHSCRCDGIGRRSGLKIHRWRQRTGSSPVTGTKNIPTPIGVGIFFAPVTGKCIKNQNPSLHTAIPADMRLLFLQNGLSYFSVWF